MKDQGIFWQQHLGEVGGALRRSPVVVFQIFERAGKNFPRLFLILAFLLGIPFAFLTPPLQVPDEFAHLYRAYGVSEGHFVARPLTTVPGGVEELAREFPIHLEKVRRISEQDLVDAARRPLRDANPVSVPNEAAGLFSFVPYLSSGAAIFLGRIFPVSPLALLYLGRLANLTTYVLLVYFALRLLPDFRFLLFCLALVPTALHQAASLSTDAVTFSVAFLLSAYLFKLAFDPAVPRIGRAHHAGVALIITLAALCKANIILLPLALLIPSEKFSSARARWSSLGCYALLASGVAAGWNLINASNLNIFEMARSRSGISPAGNWQFLARHPLLFLETVMRTLSFHAFHYLDHFVSTVGWLAASIPAWVVWSYLTLLVIVACTQTQRVALGPWQKALLLAVVVVGSAFVFIMLWGVETPDAYIRQHILAGRGHVPGMQGRYLIPFSLPLFLLFSNTKLRVTAGRLLGLAVLMICVASGATWATIRRTYYGPHVATTTGVAGRTPTVEEGGPRPTNVGVFRQGFFWVCDNDGDRQLSSPPDKAFPFGGIAGDIPVTGDWNADGHTKAGIYRPGDGLFILDYDGDGQVTAADKVYDLGVGKSAGDLPVVGDWNGDGKSKVGLFRQGYWIIDTDGDGVFKEGVDKTCAFGGVSGDLPVVGDWTGTGKSKIGVVRRGFFWVLDADGNGSFDGAGPGPDLAFAFGGSPGDVPVVGDWNGDGKSKVGVFRGGSLWVLDANGNHQFDGLGAGQDRSFSFGGVAGDRPVVGKW